MTHKDAMPVLKVDDILHRAAHGTIFTGIDLSNVQPQHLEYQRHTE